jgi:hypothetical protein
VNPLAFIAQAAMAITTARRSVKVMEALSRILKVLGALSTIIHGVGDKVFDAVSDGQITIDEAGQMAKDLMASKDIQIRIKHKDILDDETQALLAEAVGRLVASAARLLKD